MEVRARRRAAVIVGLAGMLGGAMVGLSSVDGATVQPSGTPGATGQVAAATSPAGPGSTGSNRGIPPTHSSGSAPTHSSGSTPPPTLRSIAGTAPPSSGSPKGTPTSSPKGAPTSTPKGAPTTSPTAAPRSPAAARTSPTPLAGTNNRNPSWKHDSQSWHQWDGAYQDPGWHSEHSRDSRHEHGFFGDRDHFCDRHDCDRFHTDEFRNEDRDFRHDCDVLISFHSVRALLDFLDGDSSLRDFFELHGDLYDFLVHHSDWSDDFDPDCTLIDLHL